MTGVKGVKGVCSIESRLAALERLLLPERGDAEFWQRRYEMQRQAAEYWREKWKSRRNRKWHGPEPLDDEEDMGGMLTEKELREGHDWKAEPDDRAWRSGRSQARFWEQRYDEQHETLHRLEDAYATARNQIDALRANAERHSREMGAVQDDRDKYEAEVERLESRLSKGMDDADQEVGHWKAEVWRLEAELRSRPDTLVFGRDAIVTELQAARDAYSTACNEIDVLRADAETTAEQRAEEGAYVKRLERERNAAWAEEKRLEVERDRLYVELAEHSKPSPGHVPIVIQQDDGSWVETPPSPSPSYKCAECGVQVPGGTVHTCWSD